MSRISIPSVLVLLSFFQHPQVRGVPVRGGPAVLAVHGQPVGRVRAGQERGLVLAPGQGRRGQRVAAARLLQPARRVRAVPELPRVHLHRVCAGPHRVPRRGLVAEQAEVQHGHVISTVANNANNKRFA